MNRFYDFIFEHENLYVIIDNTYKVWFAGNDIATILEYKAPKKIIETIPKRYKQEYQDIDVNKKTYTKRYQKNSMFINEIGLFRLAIKSGQPKAVIFQEWITDEVLPGLREDGYYSLKERIEFLENKLGRIKKMNKNLLIENDYLRGVDEKYNDTINYMYIIRIITTRRGKEIVCYKLGLTDDLRHRMKTYRTGNPNIDLISYFKIQNLDAKTIEKCAKTILKYKELKKNNEIFCTSLKNIYNLLESCIENGEKIKGVCRSCHQRINVSMLHNHKYCDLDNT